MTMTMKTRPRTGIITLCLLATAWPALAQVAPPPPPPPPPPRPPATTQPREPVVIDATGTSALAGTVVADDGSGRTVRRALVTVSRAGLPSRMLLTDDEGHFAFTDLPAGAYSLVVRKPGWVAGYHGARESWKGPGTPVALGDGERRADLELRLAPGAVITGRLVDEFGRPHAGARVVAFERQRHGGQDTFVVRGAFIYVMTQMTNDRGEFRIFELPPGEFVVGANVVGGISTARSMTSSEELRWAEQARRGDLSGVGPPPAQGPSLGYAPVYYPGVADVSGASIVTVGIGEERSGVNFPLSLVPITSVTGTVTTPDGQPAAGVPLFVLSPTGPVIASSALSPPSRLTTRSRPDGSFAIQSVTPGEYAILARGVGQWAEERVMVTSRDVEGLALRMQAGLSISGRLVFPGEDATRPVDPEQVSMGVLPEDQGAVSVRVPPVPANADGTFEVGGLPPGRYMLTAAVGGAGGAGWLAHRAEINGQNALEAPIELVAGGHIDEVVVEFTNRPAELSGLVTDERGRPVQGLTMVLFPAAPANWAVSADERSRRTSPLDTAGRFRLPSLPAGDYFLAAVAEVSQSDLADPAYLEQVAASAIRITLALGEKRVQDVRIGGGAPLPAPSHRRER